MPPRTLAAVVGLAVVTSAHPIHADDQIQADLQWGWVGFEATSAAVIIGVIELEPAGDARTAGISAGVAVAGAIATGVVADRLDASLASANAAHGAFVAGGTLALVGAALADERGLHVGGLSLGLGLGGAVGGALLGARLPTDGFSMPWTTMPVFGAAGGIVVGTVWTFASPSEHPMRRLVGSACVGSALGLGLGYLLSRGHHGTLYPAASASPRGPVLLSVGGRF